MNYSKVSCLQNLGTLQYIYFSGEADCTDKDNGKYPLSDCKKYLHCTGQSVANIRDCGTGKGFNPESENCENGYC